MQTTFDTFAQLEHVHHKLPLKMRWLSATKFDIFEALTYTVLYISTRRHILKLPLDVIEKMERKNNILAMPDLLRKRHQLIHTKFQEKMVND